MDSTMLACSSRQKMRRYGSRSFLSMQKSELDWEGTAEAEAEAERRTMRRRKTAERDMAAAE